MSKEPSYKYDIVNSMYLREIFCLNEFTAIVNKTVAVISEFRETNPFDAIVYSGHSGAALAYCVSYQLQIPVVCIRKPSEKAHTPSLYEGILPKKYIIIDDFISSGETIKRIKTEIRDEYAARIYHNVKHIVPKKLIPKLLAIVLFNDKNPIKKSYLKAPIIRVK